VALCCHSSRASTGNGSPPLVAIASSVQHNVIATVMAVVEQAGITRNPSDRGRLNFLTRLSMSIRESPIRSRKRSIRSLSPSTHGLQPGHLVLRIHLTLRLG
jgi:hypothetical protein